MKLTFLQYAKYLKFACDEELQRMQEFLNAVQKDEDVSDDKYYIEYPMSNCVPDKEFVEVALGDRNVGLDFSVMDSEEDEKGKEVLYLHLRSLFY